MIMAEMTKIKLYGSVLINKTERLAIKRRIITTPYVTGVIRERTEINQSNSAESFIIKLHSILTL